MECGQDFAVALVIVKDEVECPIFSWRKVAYNKVNYRLTEEIMAGLKLFTLNGNKPLAQKIATELGLPLSPASVKHFADGEIQIDLDDSVRGADVYVIQPVSDPVNENFMELMIMVDALDRKHV